MSWLRIGCGVLLYEMGFKVVFWDRVMLPERTEDINLKMWRRVDDAVAVWCGYCRREF